jgi:aryl-alcohol dehydrogenase-like predicted oxidoreductase
MNHRQLGRTGLSISDIGHGLWGMASWKDSDDAQSLRALQLSVDLGCNFFDSAWAYGEGKSDGLLGQILGRNSGKPLRAASKIPPMNRKWPASSPDLYEQVFPPDHVLKHADLIRRRLAVDAIDLLQFHVWDDSWAAHPDFRNTIEQLKRDRVIRYFGLSLNRWQPWNGIKAVQTGLVDTVQVIYNIFDQAPEDELFPACREMGVGIIARVPLDEGSLGGKLTPDTRFPVGDWRASYFGPDNLAATVARVDKLKTILPPGMTLPEMAIRFILSNSEVSTTIVGMRQEEHVRQNLAFSDGGPLSADLLTELKKYRWDRKPRTWSA